MHCWARYRAMKEEILVALILSLIFHGHEWSSLSMKVRQKQHYNSRSGQKFSGLIKPSTTEAANCETKCNNVGVCKSSAVFRTLVSCKLHNSPLAKMTIQREYTQKTTYVDVLNKFAWKTCTTPICTVTHLCKSVDVHDCQPMKRKKEKKIKKQERKPNISLKTITYITISSRYKDIIFGMGQHLKRSNRILSFKVTNNFTVREHVLNKFVPSKLTSVATTAGMTTGPCYTGRGQCMYMCYKVGDKEFRLSVFREPSVHQTWQILRCMHYRYGSETIVSIAVTKDYILYSLTILTSLAKIKAVRISTDRKGHLHQKPVLESKLLSQPLTLDITKDGAKLLVDIHRRMYLVTPDTLSKESLFVSYMDMNDTHKIKGINHIVCLMHDGQHVVFMKKEFPFAQRTVTVVRR